VCADSSRDKGLAGEELARKYLKREGLKILDVNFHARMGEIDIIARDRDTIVFVEVKSAGGPAFGDPATWIPPRKQKRIIQASLVYVMAKGLAVAPVRFDIITVNPDKKVFHVRDAFRPDDTFPL
jgi:putative endonuclease